MSQIPDRDIFPYHIPLLDLHAATFYTDLLTYEGEVIELHSAFDKFLKESQTSRLRAAHQFFYAFVQTVLAALRDSLRVNFLGFDHTDENDQTFLECFSGKILKILRDLSEAVTQTIQKLFGKFASRRIIQNILEESGIRLLFQQSFPESLLASSLDEWELVKFRRFYKQRPKWTKSPGLFENFELKLAQYQVRKRGLKLGENGVLLLRLTEEIRSRTSAYDKKAATEEEQWELSGTEDEDEDENEDKEQDSRLQSGKKQGNKKEDQRRIWKHLTISRDETSASDFLHEKIIILFLKPKLVTREQAGVGDNSKRKIESSEISEGEEEAQLSDTSSSDHALVAHTFPHQTLVGQSFPGTRLDSSFYPTFQPRYPRMNTTNNEGSVDGVQNGGGDSRISTTESDSLRCSQLVSRIASLELELQRAENNKAGHKTWKIIHFISKTHLEPSGYFDKPVMTPGIQHNDFTLRAFLPVTDVSSYVKQAGLDFVVSRFYSLPSLQGQVQGALAKNQPPPEPTHYDEYIQLHSKQMIEAVQEFLSLQPGFWDKFPDFDVRAPIHAPYMFWYMYRSTSLLHQLQEPYGHLMRMLVSWIDENYADQYAEADSQLERGVITLRTLPFLACPGDVLIWKEQGRVKSAVISSRISQTSPPILYWDGSETIWSHDNPDSGAKKGEFSTTWAANAWNYKFVGKFFRKNVSIDLKFKASSLDQEVAISKLAVYPLRFADENTRLQLERRGQTFWGCRIRNLVSYTGEDGIFTSGERFMVDFQIYKELHSDSLRFELVYGDVNGNEDGEDHERRKMSADEMESETPPTEPSIYVFPDIVPGYHLRSKKWVDLEVDRITDVKWNKKSFDSLVIDSKAKEMIQALVSHQIESEKGTDLIHRKGNGLIILLHGGPGTGKTFTAESVAEIAEKPLFCVTCGDIGTKPEQVEKYLESVLYLGKTWGCVVLIDEAEVFLEQRSLDNLERNALVSVFLRVLEYYEGILVLTTNRVGTFDEAFKSRILLSLHYEKLTKGQRRKIWRGFINHLQSTHCDVSQASQDKDNKGKNVEGSWEGVPEIAYQEILDSLDELSAHELNGRQIRNIITTARQLAKFRRQTLNYGLLEEVISLSGKFDEYFRKLNENQSDEQIARSDGIR